MRRLLEEKHLFDLCYADMIYEDANFQPWVNLSIDLLKDNGIFMVQTDHHTVAEMKVYLDSKLGKKNFINACIYLNEWGGTPKKGFPKKYDTILIYSKGSNWKWFGDRIQIPKVTAGTKFDKKGTGLKTPCDVFYDHASFSTMSKERIKTEDNHNVEWQKPYWLMDRLLAPFTDPGDWILEPFGGTFSACRWAKMNDRNAVGIELDPEKFRIGERAINDIQP
jgi:site-specific DNA-methyltransferase (adenine-specific)